MQAPGRAARRGTGEGRLVRRVTGRRRSRRPAKPQRGPWAPGFACRVPPALGGHDARGRARGAVHVLPIWPSLDPKHKI